MTPVQIKTREKKGKLLVLTTSTENLFSPLYCRGLLFSLFSLFISIILVVMFGESLLQGAEQNSEIVSLLSQPSEPLLVQHSQAVAAAGAAFTPSSESNTEKDSTSLSVKRNKKRPLAERERCTVYFGNIPAGTKAKEIRKFVSDQLRLRGNAGEKDAIVESLRVRCVPLKRDGKEPKFIAVRKGHLAEGSDTESAYVVFVNRDLARAAVELNNVVWKDRHIRVDAAMGGAAKSPKKAVFVGNLPYDASEEALRHHFESCGNIVAVRIVRDTQDARKGKGFGFVTFDSRESVAAALLLNGREFSGRELRVTACLEEEKAKEVMAKKKRRDELSVRKELRSKGASPKSAARAAKRIVAGKAGKDVKGNDKSRNSRIGKKWFKSKGQKRQKEPKEGKPAESEKDGQESQ